jgi:hypothetical protein
VKKQAPNSSITMLLIETYYSTADKASSKSKYNNVIGRLTAQQLTKQAANSNIT